jgi:hypothetical protein
MPVMHLVGISQIQKDLDNIVATAISLMLRCFPFILLNTLPAAKEA